MLCTGPILPEPEAPDDDDHSDAGSLQGGGGDGDDAATPQDNGQQEALISSSEALNSIPGGAQAWAFLPDAPAQGTELAGAGILINVASVGWQWATLAEVDAQTRMATVFFGGSEEDYDFVELSPAAYCPGFGNDGAAAGAESMGEGAWAVAMKKKD